MNGNPRLIAALGQLQLDVGQLLLDVGQLRLWGNPRSSANCRTPFVWLQMRFKLTNSQNSEFLVYSG